MAVDFSAFKQAFADYTAKVDAYVTASEQHKADVAQAVADAIAADDAGEEAALADLQKAVADAAAKVPAPPTAPEPPAPEPQA